MEHGLLEQGRLVKESAGPLFYDPAALVTFCRFNFLLRRAFIRLLHADFSAVHHAIEKLDSSGVKTVDCRRAGFSAAEPTIQFVTTVKTGASRFIRTTRRIPSGVPSSSCLRCARIWKKRWEPRKGGPTSASHLPDESGQQSL